MDEYAKELQRLQKKMEDTKGKLEALHKDMQLYWEKLGELKLTENEFKFKKEFGRQRYLNRYAELRIEIYNEVRAAVNVIGANGKFDLILRVEEPTIEEENIETVSQRINARVVLYHADSLDITDRVIQQLNADFVKKKAGAGEWECAACRIKNSGAACTKCGAKKP